MSRPMPPNHVDYKLVVNVGKVSSITAFLLSLAVLASFVTPATYAQDTSQRVGRLELNLAEDRVLTEVTDSADGFAYFGTEASEDTVVKIQLSDFTQVDTLILNSGRRCIRSAVIDTKGPAYLRDNDFPGKIVKLRLSDFASVDILELGADYSAFYLSIAIIIGNTIIIVGIAGTYLIITRRRRAVKLPSKLSEVQAEKLVPGSTVIFDTFGNVEMRILQTLEGGMGNVYVCLDKDDKKFALKTYKCISAATEEDLKRLEGRFYREAVVWIGLGIHPNIVRALTFAKMRDNPFLLLEFIDGCNLRQLMKGRQLDFGKAVRLTRDISSGMSFAHSKNVIHADIKPENILIDKNGVAKVTDFGLARVIKEESGTMWQDLAGTLPYMSPEQLLGDHVDERSDIYSFGVLFYEMLTGKNPFLAPTLGEILRAKRELIPARPSTLAAGIPPEIDRLISSCVQEDPEKRVQSFEQIRTLLSRYE